MATTIQVAGPTRVEIRLATTAGNFDLLGYADNDNLPSVTFTDHQHEIKTSISGAVPEEIVTLGTEIRISLALVKWDQTILENMLKYFRSAPASPGLLYALPGKRVVGNTSTPIRLAQLKFVGTGDNSLYHFYNVYMQTEGIGDSQWGNRERVLTLAFRTIWFQNPDAGTVTAPYLYDPDTTAQ